MGQHATAEAIRHAPSPREAQLMAKNIRTDERWKSIKQSVMYELLQEKVRQCPVFKNDLLGSDNRLLVEDTAHDYWGRGRTGTGLNMLGRLLMTLRDNVPAAISESPDHQITLQNRRHNYPQRNDQQPRCFNCGEKSHNIKTCRHSAPLQCYSCLRKRKFCPTSGQY